MIAAEMLIGVALWLAALSAAARAITPGVRILGLRWLIWLLVPPAAFFLRGVFGDPSFALPVLAAVSLSRSPLPRASRYLLVAVLGASLVLWASALGLVETDWYAAGYFPRWMLVAVGVLVGIAYRSMPALGWAWLLGLFCFVFEWTPSPNLWDALTDVPAALLILRLLIVNTAASPARRAPRQAD